MSRLQTITDLDSRILGMADAGPVDLMRVIASTKQSPGAVLQSLGMLVKRGQLTQTSPTTWKK